MTEHPDIIGPAAPNTLAALSPAGGGMGRGQRASADPSGAPDAADVLARLMRLNRLIAALDSAADSLQEAQRADAIPDRIGAALSELGIESQVSLLDTPIEPAIRPDDPSLTSATLRIVYTSIAPQLLETAERLIGRPVLGMALPLEQVTDFARVVRSRQPHYQDEPIAPMREILPWLPDTAKRQLARLVHAKTSITAPLLSRGRVLGVMSVWANDLQREDTAVLAAFARQAGVAMDNARLFEEAQQHAEELETIFASMAAGVGIYDLRGGLVRMNQAAQRITTRLEQPGGSPTDGRASFALRRTDGSPLPPEEAPAARAVRGETFNNAVYLVNGEDGPDTAISVSGAPLRGADGLIRGGVMVFHNVTQMRRLEHRTHEALQALLDMAATLTAPVARSGAARGAPGTQATLEAELRQLCRLTIGVVGGDRVAISLIDTETLLVTPVAVAGLSPEQEAAWAAERTARIEGGRRVRLGQRNPDAAWRLRRGEPVIVDMSKPPYADMGAPYDLRTVILAPMMVERQIVGVLALDHQRRTPGEPAHIYTPDEIALAEGVARLAALAVERHWLEGVAAEVEGLRAANALKEEFLSIASHELKTPLTVLQARTQSTRRRLERMGQREAAEQFAPVQASLDRLRALVQELLDASRIQAGHLELQLEPCDLGRLLAGAVTEAREVHARTITLEGAEAADLWTRGDPERLAQVLANLLDNAMKYSPPESSIAVRVRREPAEVASHGPGTRASGDMPGAEVLDASDRLVVTITDQGIGIPADEVGRVFERFYRARTASTRQYGGLGLGLHVAATIVERHGGSVWAESAGPGQGSTFGLALPALDVAGA